MFIISLFHSISVSRLNSIKFIAQVWKVHYIQLPLLYHSVNDMETTSEEILKSLESRKIELEKRVAELRSSEDELSRVSAAIAALSTNKQPKRNSSHYNAETMSWADKIKYALRELNRAGVKSITEFILEHEPNADANHVYQSVAQSANKLANAGDLKYEREGRGYIYSL